MIPKVEGKNLKKIFGFIMVLIIVVLAGCGDNNFPKAEYGNYNRVRSAAETALLNSRITKPGEFSKLTAEIAYTVERDRVYQVEFLYEEESGGVCTILSGQWHQSLMNEKEYRELLRANLTITFLELLDYYDLKSGRAVGAILEWKKMDLSGNVVKEYALCDLDGDGIWDYLTSDDNILMASFGETSDERYPKQEVNEYTTISFTSDGDIVELQNLSGTETVKNFEKIA